MVNLADLVLSLDPSFGSSGNVPSTKESQMESIQLGTDVTREISLLLVLTEGFERCSTDTRLSRSSCGVIASFSKASACEFFALGTCQTCTRMNFFSSSRTFLR